jgi:hypothetical protein
VRNASRRFSQAGASIPRSEITFRACRPERRA